MDALIIKQGWQIPAHDLSVRHAQSGGPGGQNVNKVATKVELRLALDQTDALSDGHKARLRASFPSAVTGAGEFLIKCDETRSQAANLEGARQRLKTMILGTKNPPRVRKATKPSRGRKRGAFLPKKKGAPSRNSAPRSSSS